MRHVAAPLPECDLCARPTRRAVHAANAGLCSECRTGVADTVRMLPVRDDRSSAPARRARLGAHAAAHDEENATVFVERYRPPVPGQLPLPDQPQGQE